jgi:hypothetical protein
MKEKEIDVYLALANFAQLLLLGFGGALAWEVVGEYWRTSVIFFGSMLSVISLIAVGYFYITIFHLLRKQ